MSLYSDLNEVLTPYAQKINGLSAANEEIKADLDDVNESLAIQTGITKVAYSDRSLKQYIVTNGTTVQWDTPSVSSILVKWAVVECNPGDRFTINGRGSSADRLWAFADASKNLLDPRASIGDTANNLVLVAPENARYLILNNEYDSDSYVGELPPITGSRNTNAVKYVEAKTISGSYVAVNGKIMSDSTRTRSEHIPCVEGMSVHYMGETNHSGVSALTFYDKAGNPLQVHSNVGALGTEFVATAPSGATSCIISSKPTYKTQIWFDSSPIFGYVLSFILDNDDFKREFSLIKGDYYKKTNFQFVYGFYVANNAAVGATINPSPVTSNNYCYCITPVVKGREYRITVHGGSTARAYSFVDEDYKQLALSGDQANLDDVRIIAPADGYLICNSMVSLENPALYTYVPYIEVEPSDTTFFEGEIKNMLSPDKISLDFYYSPGSHKISTSSASLTYAFSGLIPVEEGETYTVSGTALITNGGFFNSTATVTANQASIADIYFIPSRSGNGFSFTVPEGQNVAYVGFNLKKANGAINGDCQLEVGVDATDIVPYGTVWKIPNSFIDPQEETISEKIEKLPRPSYAFELGKIENFVAHFIKKDKDLMVVGTGTSLTARANEHCTRRPDETSRPPLLNTYNFASRIWDKLMWDGQQYRRYDFPSFFTETGSFSTSYNLADWDDKDARYGLTRYAAAPASFAFEIPEGAWQFNLIYRADSEGTESAVVSIGEGNGKVEVFNGTAWVEANGFTFSMRETPVVLPSATVKNPATDGNSSVTISNYQIGGNTTYQKRLKMRCKSSLIDSRDVSKSVTISATTGRLLYWGVEWSPREYMITYVNAARGSHNITYSSSTALFHFQENEIWSFKPDLMFTENPIHNSGGSGQSSMSNYYTSYWGHATDDFFFNTDSDISLTSRAAENGLTDLEWVIFTSSIAWNFNGINNDGTLKVSEDKSGKMITALDAQMLCNQWLVENKPDVIAIDACKYWCDAAFEIYGNLKDATIGSGKDGDTMTDEGSHWNDTGCAVMERCISGLFDFYN